MMKIQTLAWTIVAGLMGLSAAMAQPAEGGGGREGRKEKDPAKLFDRIDADDSGAITLEELKAAHEKRMAARKERAGGRERPERPGGGDRPPRTAEKIFDRMDADDDGSVTKDEFIAAHANRPKRGERGKRGGGKKGE